MHELVKSEPAVEIIWRAFELRPEPVPTLDPKGEYLQHAWRDSVYPLANRLGVTMRLPPVHEREAQALGVMGVPAFIAGRKADRRAALSGVQPVENLKKLVRLEVSTE